MGLRSGRSRVKRGMREKRVYPSARTKASPSGLSISLCQPRRRSSSGEAHSQLRSGETFPRALVAARSNAAELGWVKVAGDSTIARSEINKTGRNRRLQQPDGTQTPAFGPKVAEHSKARREPRRLADSGL